MTGCNPRELEAGCIVFTYTRVKLDLSTILIKIQKNINNVYEACLLDLSELFYKDLFIFSALFSLINACELDHLSHILEHVFPGDKAELFLE